MPTQPEQVLEDTLVAQLVNLGYGKVIVKDEKDLLVNLKSQQRKQLCECSAASLKPDLS